MHLTSDRTTAARSAAGAPRNSRLEPQHISLRQTVRAAEQEWRASPRPGLDLEPAEDRLHPLVAALLIMLCAGLFWFGVFYFGTTLGAWLRDVLP